MGNQLFDLRDPTVWSPALPYHCIRRHSTFSSSVDTTTGCGATTAAITMLLSVISRRTYLSLYKRKNPGGRQSRRPTQWHRLHKSFNSTTTEVIASPGTRHSHQALIQQLAAAPRLLQSLSCSASSHARLPPLMGDGVGVHPESRHKRAATTSLAKVSTIVLRRHLCCHHLPASIASSRSKPIISTLAVLWSRTSSSSSCSVVQTSTR